MPEETRNIVFDTDELLSALHVNAQNLNISVPQIPIATIEKETRRSGAYIVFHFVNNGSAQTRKLAIKSASVASCLVRYCKAKGIPLPQRAKKTVKLVPHIAALCLSLKVPQVENCHLI